MARHKLQIHPVGLVLICFGFLVWLIALGGVGEHSRGITNLIDLMGHFLLARAPETGSSGGRATRTPSAPRGASSGALVHMQSRLPALQHALCRPLHTLLPLCSAGAASYGCQKAMSYELCAKEYQCVYPIACCAMNACILLAELACDGGRDGPLPAPPPRSIPTHTLTACTTQSSRWEWWSVWFELALLLALFITCFLENQFKRGQLVFLAFFTIATVCVLLSAHNFLTQVALGPLNVRDLGQDAVNAAAAGFVLLGLTNCESADRC
jgi:hypothetical protein